MAATSRRDATVDRTIRAPRRGECTEGMAREGGRRRLDRVLEAGLRLQDMPPQFLEDVATKAASCHKGSELVVSWIATATEGPDDPAVLRISITRGALFDLNRSVVPWDDDAVSWKLLDSLRSKVGSVWADARMGEVRRDVYKLRCTLRLTLKTGTGVGREATTASPLDSLVELIDVWMRELVVENGYAHVDRVSSRLSVNPRQPTAQENRYIYSATFVLCRKLDRTLPLHDTETRQWLRRLDEARRP